MHASHFWMVTAHRHLAHFYFWIRFNVRFLFNFITSCLNYWGCSSQIFASTCNLFEQTLWIGFQSILIVHTWDFNFVWIFILTKVTIWHIIIFIHDFIRLLTTNSVETVFYSNINTISIYKANKSYIKSQLSTTNSFFLSLRWHDFY